MGRLCPKPDEEFPLPRLQNRLCPKPDFPLPRLSPSRPTVTCIFCDATMPFGTDQGSYLQHLEECSARPDLQEPKPQAKRMKLNPLSVKKSQLRRKMYCC